MNTEKLVIGLGYRAQSGKDTIANYLVDKYGFIRVAFADKLKEVLYDLDPIALVSVGPGMHDFGVAELVDRFGWDEAKEHTTVREMLQRLGVAMRKVDPDVWVRPVRQKILDTPGNFVITDLRFPNEMKMINDLNSLWCNAVTVRVDRDGLPPMTHESEHALDGHLWDAVIQNNLSVLKLQQAVDDFILEGTGRFLHRIDSRFPLLETGNVTEVLNLP